MHSTARSGVLKGLKSLTFPRSQQRPSCRHRSIFCQLVASQRRNTLVSKALYRLSFYPLSAGLQVGRSKYQRAQDFTRCYAWRSAKRPDLPTRPADEEAYEDAKQRAAALLQSRPHSREELVKKLQERGFQQSTSEAAVDRLKELGLQSDVQYAEVYVRSKWRQSLWGPSRIRMELVRRGVKGNHIDAALQAVFGEDKKVIVEEEDEDLGSHGERTYQQLLWAAKKQAELSQGMPGETRRRRLAAWLQRRGHSWGTIEPILKKLDL